MPLCPEFLSTRQFSLRLRLTAAMTVTVAIAVFISRSTMRVSPVALFTLFSLFTPVLMSASSTGSVIFVPVF